ncbi:peptidylprolyl isomerase [Salmonella enterica subsp. enterica serovar Lexington]|uniref:peptidylprolyl isomerase n=1 Tax=Salmonella enterica TaxID=28901 RepID=A0A5Y5TBV2_SALER|nr:peptidylprolyl isomerase [Salmonella enterica subsp. enterica serovar Weltevreden]EAC0964163.1 peptidylprolyl isomerase [Salmonella enterica subsp. enterica serovar Newport]EAM2795107.1 peptidylprolyl isomerase [Salmonella enterica]EBR9007993.1 peptidylprolyl isomerase [Salmonella enterica subsp. enterica serovar Richmond]EBU7426989.1 peptidylprolyl isomerase [Salmonella enterica subsp. enterica serovar Lexington]EBU7739046.1 peptidylprolyl isomerase [Salmonella enterica subsp. enterica ser
MSRTQETFLSGVFCCREGGLIFLLIIGLMCGGTVFAAEADNGLPGVLKYAQTYGEKKVEAKKSGSGSPVSEKRLPAESTSFQRGNNVQDSELRRRWQQRERELKRLREENRHLQKSIANLKERGSFGATRDPKSCGEKAKQQSELGEVTLLALKKQIQDKENYNRKQQVALETCLTSVQEKGKQAEQLLKDNNVLTAEMSALEKQLEQMPVIQAKELDTPDRNQTYAAGVMLGRDIRKLQEAQMLLGIKTDNRILMAGLNDSLSNRVLLNGETLERALTEAEESARKATLNIITAQRKAGKAWLSAFRKEKGVTKANGGFWYRLDYAGDGALITGDTSTVEVVVTEKLTDGTVVEDMDARGRSLSMALGDFPPLFREALMLMKNHSTMTLVAPPELAYGDEGYPPKVPPGATMVYTLRVENVETVPDIVLPEPGETGKMADGSRDNREVLKEKIR